MNIKPIQLETSHVSDVATIVKKCMMEIFVQNNRKCIRQSAYSPKPISLIPVPTATIFPPSTYNCIHLVINKNVIDECRFFLIKLNKPAAIPSETTPVTTV